jgi:hypothetical protein
VAGYAPYLRVRVAEIEPWVERQASCPCSALLRNGEVSPTQFMRQKIHVDLFQKSDPERVDHGAGATKDDLGQLNEPASICVFCVNLPGFA